MEIVYTEFFKSQEAWTIQIEINLFPTEKTVSQLIFTKLTPPWQLFVKKNSYTNVHENPTNGVGVDTESHRNEEACHRYENFFRFLVCKEHILYVWTTTNIPWEPKRFTPIVAYQITANYLYSNINRWRHNSDLLPNKTTTFFSLTMEVYKPRT